MQQLITILYYSKGNNTKFIAEHISQKLKELSPPHINIELMDATDLDIPRLLESNAFIIGSPDYYSYVAGYIKVFFDEFYFHRTKVRNRPAFGFISHGGGGDAKQSLKLLITAIKFDNIGEIITIRNRDITPTHEQQISKYCDRLLQKLK